MIENSTDIRHALMRAVDADNQPLDQELNQLNVGNPLVLQHHANRVTNNGFQYNPQNHRFEEQPRDNNQEGGENGGAENLFAVGNPDQQVYNNNFIGWN